MPIHLSTDTGQLYVFQIQLDDLVYFVEYKAGKLSYKPEWVVNDPIEFRVGKEDRAFPKRPDGKGLEVVIVEEGSATVIPLAQLHDCRSVAISRFILFPPVHTAKI